MNVSALRVSDKKEKGILGLKGTHKILELQTKGSRSLLTSEIITEKSNLRVTTSVILNNNILKWTKYRLLYQQLWG
jgi:hypothetical protein